MLNFQITHVRSLEAVANVLPSLEKATQFMGSLAALVGLVITSPVSAL